MPVQWKWIGKAPLSYKNEPVYSIEQTIRVSPIRKEKAVLPLRKNGFLFWNAPTVGLLLAFYADAQARSRLRSLSITPFVVIFSSLFARRSLQFESTNKKSPNHNPKGLRSGFARLTRFEPELDYAIKPLITRSKPASLPDSRTPPTIWSTQKNPFLCGYCARPTFHSAQVALKRIRTLAHP